MADRGNAYQILIDLKNNPIFSNAVPVLTQLKIRQRIGKHQGVFVRQIQASFFCNLLLITASNCHSSLRSFW